MGLSCVNCGKEVGSDEAKFFAQVFVCPDCFSIAERLYVKGEKELRMMLVMLKECIRLAIVKKELQFPEQNVEDMPRKDLFAELARMAQDARLDALRRGDPDAPHPTPDDPQWRQTQTSSTLDTTPSPESTKLLADGQTAPGPPSSDSTSR